MKRILHVVSCLDYGGTEAFIMNNYWNLDRSKYQFDFLVFQKDRCPYVPEIQSLGGRVFYADIPNSKNIQPFFKRFQEIVREAGPFQIVHAHVNLMNGFILKAAKKCGVPIRISHCHATDLGVAHSSRLWTAYKKMLIRKYGTRWLACSDAAGETLYGEKMFAHRGNVVLNGIDVKKFLDVKPADCAYLKEAWNIPSDCPFIVGNITRFDVNKNGLFAIKVFHSILQMAPNAILVMGGPDVGQLQPCRELVKKMGIEQNVRFVGKRKDIPQCLRLIDLYLFPSFTEGLGIALLEAQAAGCFCAASSSIVRSVDIGLDSVRFIDLSAGEVQWGKDIMNAYRTWKPAEKNVIMDKFIASGFEIHQACKELLRFYDDKV